MKAPVYTAHIADYMRRWCLRLPGGGTLRLHHIARADADPEMHDHPFDFYSLVLRGGYTEQRVAQEARRIACLPDATVPGTTAHDLAAYVYGPRSPIRRTYTERRAGLCLAYRRAEEPHRIDDVQPGGAWTLVLTGPRRRTWGFWTDTGWTPYSSFASVKPGL